MKFHSIFVVIFLLTPILILAQNKVGINIDTPTVQLDVRASASDENAMFNLASTDNVYFTRLLAGHAGFEASSLSWTTGIPFNFGMWDGFNYTQVMQLSPLRRVGINTFDPQFDLDVRGTTVGNIGGVLQVATEDEAHFVRLFSGRQVDGQPFIAFHEADSFHIVSASPDWSIFNTHLSIMPDGKVGIGESSPQAKLDIYSDQDSTSILRLQTARPWAFKQYGTGSSALLALQSEVDYKAFEIQASNGNRVARFYAAAGQDNRVNLVLDGGYVSIGTDQTLGKLHLFHNSTIPSPQLRLTEEFDDFARIKMENTANVGAYWDIAGQSDTLQDNARLNFFFHGDDGSGDRLTIRGNGNIGIGTTSPAAKLDIIGGNWNLDGGSPGDLRIGDATYNLRIGIATGGGGAGISRIYAQGGSNSMWFGTNNQPRMVIDGDGDIGIGTTDPQAKLQIKQNTSPPLPHLKLTETEYDYTRLQMENTSQVGALWTIASLSDNTPENAKLNFFYSGTGESGDRMTIRGDGNVGIGTNNPNNKLKIVGSTTTSANVLSASTGYSGNSNVRAVEGLAFPAIGYGVGGHFEGGWRGVRAYAYGNSSTDLCIAVEASAFGTSGIRTGLFGRASGGTTNWAGYFAEGNVYVTNDLRIGGGAQNGVTGYKVAVDGKIIAEELRVQLSQDWPDYVFEPEYELMPLSELSSSLQNEKHLPGIPSAQEIEKSGQHLGEMQIKMLEKIEELTLYIIQLEERISELEKQ